jgi:hypothetical protein
MRQMARQISQITVRGLNPQVMAEIQRVARAKGISLNKAALTVLTRGAGLEEPPDSSRLIGNALNRFVGTWTAKQANDFSRSTRSLEQVDEDLWK